MGFTLIYETLEKGGWLLPVIFGLMAAGWYLLYGKLPAVRAARFDAAGLTGRVLTEFRSSGIAGVDQVLKAESPAAAPYVRVVRAVCSAAPLARRVAAEEVLLSVRPALTAHLGTVAVIASVTPLLGLLGTVSGMMETFNVIHLFGASNPMLMADGISEALITTQAGLVASFPLVLGLAAVRQRVRTVMQECDRTVLRLLHELNCNLPEGG